MEESSSPDQALLVPIAMPVPAIIPVNLPPSSVQQLKQLAERNGYSLSRLSDNSAGVKNAIFHILGLGLGMNLFGNPSPDRYDRPSWGQILRLTNLCIFSAYMLWNIKPTITAQLEKSRDLWTNKFALINNEQFNNIYSRLEAFGLCISRMLFPVFVRSLAISVTKANGNYIENKDAILRKFWEITASTLLDQLLTYRQKRMHTSASLRAEGSDINLIDQKSLIALIMLAPAIAFYLQNQYMPDLGTNNRTSGTEHEWLKIPALITASSTALGYLIAHQGNKQRIITIGEKFGISTMHSPITTRMRRGITGLPTQAEDFILKAFLTAAALYSGYLYAKTENELTIFASVFGAALMLFAIHVVKPANDDAAVGQLMGRFDPTTEQTSGKPTCEGRFVFYCSRSLFKIWGYTQEGEQVPSPTPTQLEIYKKGHPPNPV